MGAGGQSRYLIISLSSTLLLHQRAEHGALLFTCGWLGALCGNFKVGEGLVAALELSYSAATVMSSGNTGAFGRREDRPGGGGERGGGAALVGLGFLVSHQEGFYQKKNSWHGVFDNL